MVSNGHKTTRRLCWLENVHATIRNTRNESPPRIADWDSETDPISESSGGTLCHFNYATWKKYIPSGSILIYSNRIWIMNYLNLLKSPYTFTGCRENPRNQSDENNHLNNLGIYNYKIVIIY